jgi:hypothetical protein
MPALFTNHRKEAAIALIQLANSDKPIVARYHLRNRSKLNQPKCQNYTQNATPATIDYVVAAAIILDHQTRSH